MARASRRIRKIRRIKRERSLAFRMLDVALAQRDVLRQLAVDEHAKVMELELNAQLKSELEKESCLMHNPSCVRDKDGHWEQPKEEVSE